MSLFLEGNRRVSKEYLGEDSLLFSAVESDEDSNLSKPGSLQLEKDVAPLLLELLRRASCQAKCEPAAGDVCPLKSSSLGSAALEVPFSKKALTEESVRLFHLPDSAQDSENLYSMSNWAPLYLPLLEKIDPKRIVEIGVELGGNTAILEKFCIKNGVELHLVDTILRPEAGKSDHGLIHRHQARSVDFLADFQGAEVYFIDADHNYQSVVSELELIERVHGNDAPLLIVLDDAGWPFGFRDAYYDLSTVGLGPHVVFGQKGPLPWRTDLVETGFWAGSLGWVGREGGTKNGVRTAIEDFVAHRKGWKRAYFTPFYGVCFLWLEPSFSEEQQRYMRDLISSLEWAEPVFATLEWNRVLLYLKVQNCGALWRAQQEVIEKLVAENRYAGELWQKQQDWIQHLEGQLRGKQQ